MASQPASQPAPQPEFGSRAVLTDLFAGSRAQVAPLVESTLAAFETDAAAGTLLLAEGASLEAPIVAWTPPAGWHRAAAAVVQAVATRAQCCAGWNGCPRCPIWFFQPAADPPSVTGEEIALIVGGFCPQASTECLETLAGLFDKYFAKSGPAAPGTIGASAALPCRHWEEDCAFAGQPRYTAVEASPE